MKVQKRKRGLAVLLVLCMTLFTAPLTANAAAGTKFAPNIAAGYGESAAVAQDGSLWIWGSDSVAFGSDVPIQGTEFENETITTVSVGNGHTVFLTSDGTLYGFGANYLGQLGSELPGAVVEPTALPAFSNKEITDVAAGSFFTVALESNGTVWAVGKNMNGQLGDGTTTNTAIPIEVTGLADKTITAVVAGGFHAAALADDGTVWTWGYNLNGQLGNGTVEDSSTPVQVTGLSGITAIGVGQYFSAALASDGSVWSWGNNLYGQLGNGSTDASSIPVQISGDTLSFTAIAVGGSHTVALADDGSVWTWGCNNQGQLGDGTGASSSVPVQVTGLTGKVITAVAAGSDHTVVVANDGTAWAWGGNLYGQLGNGEGGFDAPQAPAPVQVKGAEPAPDTHDATITATASIPSPTYTVNIPAVVDAGDLVQKAEADTDKVKSTTFSVSASSIENLFGEKKVVVSLTAADGKFALKNGDDSLEYTVYNQETGGEALASGATFTEFTSAISVTGRVDIDQSKITQKGTYTGTMTFSISLEDII